MKKKRKKGKIEKVIEPEGKNKPYVFYLEDSNKRFSIFNENPGKEGEYIDFNYTEKDGEDTTFYNVTDINSQSDSNDIQTASGYKGVNNQEKFTDAVIFGFACILEGQDAEDPKIMARYSRLKAMFDNREE